MICLKIFFNCHRKVYLRRSINKCGALGILKIVKYRLRQMDSNKWNAVLLWASFPIDFSLKKKVSIFSNFTTKQNIMHATVRKLTKQTNQMHEKGKCEEDITTKSNIIFVHTNMRLYILYLLYCIKKTYTWIYASYARAYVCGVCVQMIRHAPLRHRYLSRWQWIFHVDVFSRCAHLLIYSFKIPVCVIIIIVFWLATVYLASC